jgi:hypothetical protein
MTTIAVLKRRTDNLAQRRLQTSADNARADAPSRKLSIPAIGTLKQQFQPSTQAMAACQPRNQPPPRTRRSRAHTFRIRQIPIAECAAFSAPIPPRVPSLVAFGRRPLVYVAPMSLAGIRNPTQ